jgi:acyl dehydratase
MDAHAELMPFGKSAPNLSPALTQYYATLGCWRARKCGREGVVTLLKKKASGWHTAAITMRLLVEGGLPLAGGVIGAGGELDWPNPTRPGDALYVESEVLEVRPSRSRPDRGVATVRSLTRNQRNEVVQRLTAKLIVARRV